MAFSDQIYRQTKITTIKHYRIPNNEMISIKGNKRAIKGTPTKFSHLAV